MATDPERMQEILERALQPADRAYRVADCRIRTERGHGSSRSVIMYDLRLEDPATGRTWDQMVTGIRFGSNRARRIARSLGVATPPETFVEGPFGVPAFGFLPDLGMLVQAFPHDYALPALEALMAGGGGLRASMLCALGPGAWHVAGWDAEPVRYRPGVRATLRIDLSARDDDAGRSATLRTYAKIYPDAEQGSAGVRAQRAVQAAAAAAGAPFDVAPTIAYDEDLNTMVQREVGGASLHSIMRNEADPSRSVRLAARAAAAFHGLDIELPAGRVAGDEPARPLVKAQRDLHAARPALARTLDAILEAAAVQDAATGPTHGDMKPNHLLLDGDRVALIDLDDVSIGVPLLDVANLVAQLALDRSSDRAVRSVRVFLGEYALHAPAAWRARISAIPVP